CTTTCKSFRAGAERFYRKGICIPAPQTVAPGACLEAAPGHPSRAVLPRVGRRSSPPPGHPLINDDLRVKTRAVLDQPSMNAVAHFLPRDARSVIDCASRMRPQSTEGWRRAAHRGKISAQLAWLVAIRVNLAPLATAGLLFSPEWGQTHRCAISSFWR